MEVARVAAHWGYRPGEVPTYGTCACGQGVRLDRLDLLAEHIEVCAGHKVLIPSALPK